MEVFERIMQSASLERLNEQLDQLDVEFNGEVHGESLFEIVHSYLPIGDFNALDLEANKDSDVWLRAHAPAIISLCFYSLDCELFCGFIQILKDRHLESVIEMAVCINIQLFSKYYRTLKNRLVHYSMIRIAMCHLPQEPTKDVINFLTKRNHTLFPLMARAYLLGKYHKHLISSVRDYTTALSILMETIVINEMESRFWGAGEDFTLGCDNDDPTVSLNLHNYRSISPGVDHCYIWKVKMLLMNQIMTELEDPEICMRFDDCRYIKYCIACCMNDTEAARRYLCEYRQGLMICYEPLVWAIIHRNVELVRMIIDVEGGLREINSSGDSCDNAICACITVKSKESLDLILNHPKVVISDTRLMHDVCALSLRGEMWELETILNSEKFAPVKRFLHHKTSSNIINHALWSGRLENVERVIELLYEEDLCIEERGVCAPLSTTEMVRFLMFITEKLSSGLFSEERVLKCLMRFASRKEFKVDQVLVEGTNKTWNVLCLCFLYKYLDHTNLHEFQKLGKYMVKELKKLGIVQAVYLGFVERIKPLDAPFNPERLTMRFFWVSQRLPLELRMKICNLSLGDTRNFISDRSICLAQLFDEPGKSYLWWERDRIEFFK